MTTYGILPSSGDTFHVRELLGGQTVVTSALETAGLDNADEWEIVYVDPENFIILYVQS